MITSLKVSTKSAGAVAWPPYTKANENLIPVLPISTYPNLRGTNNKKRQPWKRNTTCIRCQKRFREGSMYRRQLLLASTSLPLKPQQMLAAMLPPPNLTDYQKLANAVQEAEKLKKTSHGRQEISDVAGWLNTAGSLKPPSCTSPDELSGIVAVAPAPEESLRRGDNEKDVVTARVRRPEAFKPMIRFQHKKEQLVLQGIEVTNDKPLCFDVYIKFRQEDDDEEEELYAGTFCHMPPPPKQQRRHNAKPVFDADRQEQKRARRCCLRLGMNDISTHRPLITHQEEIVTVKLVPTINVNEDPIKVESIFIDCT